MNNNSATYFLDRATVRNFREELPDRELIESMLAQAMHAPTTGNMQLYSAVITTAPERLAALRQCHFNQPASQAPMLITILADVRRFERWCELSDAKPCFRNLQGLTAAVLDAALFAQQLTTIAEMNGLGTCWLGTTTYNAPEISKLLNCPDGTLPVGTLAIGYPGAPAQPCERLPLEAVIYSEQYPDLSDRQIIELYKAKDDYEPNKKFVKENDKQTLAQVFTDIRYPASTSEPFSEKFAAFIRSQGFTL